MTRKAIQAVLENETKKIGDGCYEYGQLYFSITNRCTGNDTVEVPKLYISNIQAGSCFLPLRRIQRMKREDNRFIIRMTNGAWLMLDK